MDWKTNITNIEKGKEYIHGYALEELMAKKSFSEVIFLLLKGQLPSDQESKMMDALLVSVVDHGPGVASALAARISASAKNPMHASVAAGLLGMGDRHGVVISQAMDFFKSNLQEKNIVDFLRDMKSRKQYVMGYGHKIFTDEDPRAKKLFEIARELGIYGDHCRFSEDIEVALSEISSRKLPLNADGAIAAILCDMGFDHNVGDGFFIMSRVPGLVAHVYEENASGLGIRRVSQDDIAYGGIEKRGV